MTAKVIPVFGEPIAREPCKEVVESLEALLEEARAGEIIAIFYAGVRPNGEGFYTAECPRPRDWWPLVGSAEVGRHLVLANFSAGPHVESEDAG